MMLTAVFVVALIYVSVKMLIWGIKAAWGIAKFVALVVLLPLIIIGLALIGLFYIALTLIVVIAVLITLAGVLRI